jgi:hypothetical protein
MDESQAIIKSREILNELNQKPPAVKAALMPDLAELLESQIKLEQRLNINSSGNLGAFPLIPIFVGVAAVATSGLAYLTSRQLSGAAALQAKAKCIEGFMEQGQTAQQAETMCQASLININPLQLALGALALAVVIRLFK